MSGSSKNKGALWYGYLEAGDKSTAVVRDAQLDTGNRKTTYLFNLARNEILEYTRAVVEPKLRELKPAEAKLVDALDAAYDTARRTFKQTHARPLNIPEHTAPAKAAKPAEEEGPGDFYPDTGGERDDADVWIDSAEEEA